MSNIHNWLAMREILSVVLVLMAFVTSYAQKPKGKVFQMTENHYHPVKKFGEWKTGSRKDSTLFVFDAQGNSIRKYVVYPTGDIMDYSDEREYKVIKCSYEYDSKGRLLHVFNLKTQQEDPNSFAAAQGDTISKKDYIRSTIGQVLEINTYKHPHPVGDEEYDASWYLEEKTKYSYSGNTTTIATYNGNGDEIAWKSITKEGRKTTTKEKSPFNPYSTGYPYVEFFNERGRLCIAYRGTEAKHNPTWVFAYNQHGDTLSIIKSGIDLKGVSVGKSLVTYKSEEMEKITFDYEYDDKGNWVSCIKYKNGNPIDICIRKFVYATDEQDLNSRVNTLINEEKLQAQQKKRELQERKAQEEGHQQKAQVEENVNKYILKVFGDLVDNYLYMASSGGYDYPSMRNTDGIVKSVVRNNDGSLSFTLKSKETLRPMTFQEAKDLSGETPGYYKQCNVSFTVCQCGMANAMLFEVHGIGLNDYHCKKLLVFIEDGYEKDENHNSDAIEYLASELEKLRSPHKVKGLKVYEISDKVSMLLRLK